MTPTTVFSIVNTMAMSMWVLMLFLPRWKLTRFLIDYKVVPILLSVVYAMYIIRSILSNGLLDFGSLSSVMQLFTEEHIALAGWVHYLAFDLLVGMWILDKNKALGIHHMLIAPCLFLTFLFGPIGFLLFILIKMLKPKKP
ncbi:MAG: ABA4-like family protein [Maribacter sp.]